MKENQRFGIYIERTFKKIISTYQQVFRDNNIDLTIEQWVILQRIDTLGQNASQAEIANTSYRNRATTSRVIEGLRKKHLIKKERFDGDLKRYKLVLTSKGHEAYKEALPLVETLRTIGHQKISQEKFDILIEVLDQIWENYDQAEVMADNN